MSIGPFIIGLQTSLTQAYLSYSCFCLVIECVQSFNTSDEWYEPGWGESEPL